MAEAWRRGYNGERCIAHAGSDYDRAWREGRAAQQATPEPSVPDDVARLVRFMESAFVPMTPQQEEIKKALALASASLAAQTKGGEA